MLREQLRQMIKDKSPQENIQQLIDKININLDKAQTLLAGTELPVQRLPTISSTTNHANITTTSSSTALNATNKVRIMGDEVKEPYMPHTININTGDKVSWINTDVEIHTVTSGSENSADKGKQFDSGLLKTNQTFEHTFKKAGVYNYFCTNKLLDKVSSDLKGQGLGIDNQYPFNSLLGGGGTTGGDKNQVMLVLTSSGKSLNEVISTLNKFVSTMRYSYLSIAIYCNILNS